jgi:general stress protein YciG
MPTSNTKSRGFASMNTDKQREIARKGGRAAHEKGTAHEFTSDEARAAGRKGGERVSANRDHMSRIGRLGGKRSAGRRAPSTDQPGSDQGGAAFDEGFGKGSGERTSTESGDGQMHMSAQPGQSPM